MITSEQVKQFIREECKVEIVGIAPATPYSEEDKERTNTTFETLKNANPAVDFGTLLDPKDFVDGAKAVIVFGENFYFGRNPYSEEGGSEVPRGVIGNFYLNSNILNKLIEYTSSITTFLESKGFKADSPYVGFSHKIKALQAGIGIRGKNNLVLNKQLGSWLSLSAIITDAPLEPDEALKGDCGKCDRCIKACPTGALTAPHIYQVDKCNIYNLCHLKDEIPIDARDKIGTRIGDCTTCSDVCPRNSNLKINEADKLPDDMIYPELIPLMNMSEEEYEQKYGPLMFGFIIGGRRYLRRNVAVALGNSGDRKALPCLEIAVKDEDPLVSSHAEWAIEKIKN